MPSALRGRTGPTAGETGPPSRQAVRDGLPATQRPYRPTWNDAAKFATPIMLRSPATLNCNVAYPYPTGLDIKLEDQQRSPAPLALDRRSEPNSPGAMQFWGMPAAHRGCSGVSWRPWRRPKGGPTRRVCPARNSSKGASQRKPNPEAAQIEPGRRRGLKAIRIGKEAASSTQISLAAGP
jgi:hypothetical protein